MDQLSDILSSFFVNPNNKKKSSREKKKSRTEIATQTEFDTFNEASVIEEKEVTVKEETQATVKEETQATVLEETKATVLEENQATVKEETQATVKEASVKEETQASVLEETKATVKEATVKEASVLEASVKEATVKEATVLEENQASENEASEKRSTVKPYSDLSSDTTSEEEIPELKKYILKPSDFYKKNMMIINKDFESSILILSEILRKLSIMKCVDTIFDSNVYITSTDEHKSIYKQILLNNPHLYFTDIHVKNKLDKIHFKTLNESRTIHIIDNELLSSIEPNDFQYLLDDNVLLIIISKDDDKNAVTTYDLLTSNKILIHRLGGSKMMQKNFYKIFIKYVCKEQVSNFENYYKMINDENLDIKYLILKNDELRYN